MRVYIASKYLDHKDVNQKIYNLLVSQKIDAFLPKSINVDAITTDEMFYVAETCYSEIEKCDVILIVSPFGKSVSSEIGYAIALRRNNQHKKIILYNLSDLQNAEVKKEAMIMPYIDAEISDITELVNYIKEIKN